MGGDFVLPMVVAIVAIVFGTWAFVSVTKLVLTFFRDRNAMQSAGSSLTSSELRRIVGESVEDAMRPLEEKIERLERQQKRLDSARPPLNEQVTLPVSESSAAARHGE